MILLVAAGIVVRLAEPTVPDPKYEGKRLSEYVAVLPAMSSVDHGYDRAWPDGLYLGSMTPAERKECLEKIGKARREATNAIVMLDSKSFSLLLHWLGRREPATEKAWEKVQGKAVPLLRRLGIGGRWFPQCRTELCRSQAMTALIVLYESGCDLTPLVPDFTRMVGDGDMDPNVKGFARGFLRLLDHNALAQLEKQERAGMTNTVSRP